MKNNKGFVAISLIYSFFTVFLVTLLTIALSYAENRVLLNDVKKETKNYLDNLNEFNAISLAKKVDASGNELRYSAGEEVYYAGETWVVLEDFGPQVKLILKRVFTNEEVKSGLEAANLDLSAQNNQATFMCLPKYHYAVCNYENNITKSSYTWNRSVVKLILEDWFSKQATLQKAKSLHKLIEMQFSDGTGANLSDFIRIPLSAEQSIINSISSLPNNDMWFLTRQTDFTVLIDGVNTNTYTTYKNIRPVLIASKTN